MKFHAALMGIGAIALASGIAGAEDAVDSPPDGARLIAEGFRFPEGPLVDRTGVLFFSDPRGNQILRVEGGRVEVFLDNTKGANGLAMDKAGNIFGCQGGGAAIIKIDPQGNVETFVSEVGGQPLNSPNDAVFDDHGNLYFTNPGGRKDSPPNVVKARPDGTAQVVASDQRYPNGIVLSPDEKTLYVNDYLTGSVWKYPIAPDGEVGAGSVFVQFDRGGPDGMAVAESGNVYVALGRSSKVVVLSPSGEQLKEYAFPQRSGVSNVCFGGPDFQTLFVTLGAKGMVYAVPVDEPGHKLYSHRP